MGRSDQRRIVEIDRGLFLVRYATAEDEEQPPKVTVAPDVGSDSEIEFVLHPDHDEAVLWQPGSCVVVRATTPGRLAVDVVPLRQNGSAAASITIEPLTQGRRASVTGQPRRDDDRTDVLSGVRVLGHIASIGDVMVDAGKWLAGPVAPSRIEGISIEWPNKPEEIDIHYSIKTARPQTISGRTVALGTFAGTRGKALPIVGITLEMSGPTAANFQIDIEALFLGSPAVRRIGTRIALSGPTGREPLVGLRIAIESPGATMGLQPSPATSRLGNTASRVRVFRSRARQDQSAAP
jgi:hypothetical protein